MDTFQLGEDEAVIMKDSHEREASFMQITLVLTTQNIIEVKRGLLGKGKSCERFPLLDLKVLNGKPNVLVGKAPNGTSRLELYFTSFEKYYTFQSANTEKKWVNAISKAYKERIAEEKKKERLEKNGGAFLPPLKNTLDSARKAVMPKPKKRAIKTVKCPRCGADLTGEKGSEVTCPYCDAVITL